MTRGSAKNDMQFTGKPNIAGIEAYDFNARYYDPEIGRFYSIDPMWNPAESPYAYCYNNPVNFIDPTGMEKLKGTAIVVYVDDEIAGVLGGYRMEGDVCKPYIRNPVSAMADFWWIYEHTRSMYPDERGGRSGYVVQWRLFEQMQNALKGGNGGGNTNTGPTTPPGRPTSELGAVTGGTGNSGATDPTGNGGVPAPLCWNTTYLAPTPLDPIASMRKALQDDLRDCYIPLWDDPILNLLLLFGPAKPIGICDVGANKIFGETTHIGFDIGKQGINLIHYGEHTLYKRHLGVLPAGYNKALIHIRLP